MDRYISLTKHQFDFLKEAGLIEDRNGVFYHQGAIVVINEKLPDKT